MRYRILPYQQGSRSAAALAEGLEGRVLLLENSRYRRKEGDFVINWGNTNPNQLCNLNGNVEALRVATNKRHFFTAIGAPILAALHLGRERTGDRDWRAWSSNLVVVDSEQCGTARIPQDAFPIVCRTVLAGHSGEGIVIADTREQLVPAQLYVQYVKKNLEFRIHVGKHEGRSIIISEQRKVAREGITPQDWRIRNLANGFVFQRQNISVPDSVKTVATATLDVLPGVDFGAVDVIYNERRQRPYVLEVNSAPGLEGQTVNDYADFFRRFV